MLMLNDTEICRKYAAERKDTRIFFLCLAVAGVLLAMAGHATGLSILVAEGIALSATGICSAVIPSLGLGILAITSIGVIGVFTIAPPAIASAPTASGYAESLISGTVVLWMLARFFLISDILYAAGSKNRERQERRTATMERVRSFH